jgi:hypothetical protein
MNSLPETDHTPVLRTDFAEDAAWEETCSALRQPSEDGFRANVSCVSDPAYDGLTVERLVALSVSDGRSATRTFAFVVDRVTLSSPERPVLVVDLHDDPGRSFRVIPREAWGVENNLSLANMDFSEFADHVGPDGVFRGFQK